MVHRRGVSPVDFRVGGIVLRIDTERHWILARHAPVETPGHGARLLQQQLAEDGAPQAQVGLLVVPRIDPGQLRRSRRNRLQLFLRQRKPLGKSRRVWTERKRLRLSDQLFQIPLHFPMEMCRRRHRRKKCHVGQVAAIGRRERSEIQ